MTDAVLHGLDRPAVADQQRCVVVTQIVETGR
jgi:hypothetical protein